MALAEIFVRKGDKRQKTPHKEKKGPPHSEKGPSHGEKGLYKEPPLHNFI